MRKTKKKSSVRKAYRSRRSFKKRRMRGGNKTFTIKAKMPEESKTKILDKIKKIFKSGEEFGYVNSRISKVINQKILTSKGDMYDIQVELKPDTDYPGSLEAQKLNAATSSDIVKELNRIVKKFKKRGLSEYDNIKFKT